MPKFDVTIATCRKLPEPDLDEAPLLDALQVAGLRVRKCPWEDEDVDWSQGRLTLIRSTWNYYHHRPAFVEWARRVAAVSVLYNPAEIVAWNSHKGYLLELAARGVAVVPTALVEQGRAVTLESICRERGWSRIVMKPAVSAASFETHAMSVDALDEAAFGRLLEQHDVLVQPYVESVDTHGERCLIVIDGQLTHCVRKHPRFAGQHEKITGPYPASQAERDFALQVLGAVPTPLFYARVDVVQDDHGAPMLAELEILEPSLFFRFGQLGLDRFVAGVVRRLDDVV